MAIIEIKPYGDNGKIAGVSTSCRLRVRMERGALKSTGAIDNDKVKFTTYIRSSMLIKLNGATKVTGVNLNGFTVYEYSSSFGFIKTSAEGATLSNNCAYIKIAKQASLSNDDVFLSFDGFPEEVYNVQIEKGNASGVYASGINSGKRAAETLVFDVDGDVFTTAKLLLPPNYSINGNKVPLFIYSACDGSYRGDSSNGYGWDNAIDRNDSLRDLTTELQYMADEGFAVLNIYPWGSYNNTNYTGCGWSTAVVPVALRGYEKAVEYVTSRFNISDQHIYQASHSGGGKLSSHYAIHKPAFNLEHIYAFAPVIDGLCFNSWGATYTDFRRAIAHEMNMEAVTGGNYDVFVGTNGNAAWPMTNDAGKAFIMGNFEKFAKCSALTWHNLSEQTPAQKQADTNSFGETWNTTRNKSGGATAQDWANLDGEIYNRDGLTIFGDGVPISILGGVDDADCPYLVMREFVNQLTNGGGNAELITLPMIGEEDYDEEYNANDPHPLNRGHRAAVYYHSKTNVQTRYGSTYSTVPYGWWYAVSHIYTHYLNNE